MNSNRPNNSKDTLLHVVIPVLLAALIGGTMLLYSHYQKEQLIANTDTVTQDVANAVAVEINTTVSFARSSIMSVALEASQQMTSPELENPSEKILPLVERTPFNSIEYIRADGMNVMNIDKPFDASGREYYTEGIKGRTGVWNNYAPKIAKETLMNFYTPLMYQGKPAGVITGYISAKTQISPLLKSSLYGESVYGLLLDSKGRIVTTSLNNDFVKNYTLDMFLEELGYKSEKKDKLKNILTKASPTAVKFEDLDGEGRVCVHPVANTDWLVAMIVPAKTITGIVDENMRNTYHMLFAVAFLLGLYILLIVYRHKQDNKKNAEENARLQDINNQLREQKLALEKAAAERQELKIIKSLNEELTEATIKAEAANKAKTAFLFHMSHDIRTPMNAILGFTELLKKEISNPERAEDYLGKIQKSGEFLLALINNVLDVARIDSGNVTLDEGFFDLICDGKDNLTILEETCKKKKLHVTHDIDVKHRYVWLDVVKAREIFLNLFSNAVKYTPDNGSIAMSLRELPQTREGYATYVIKLSDTGIGMSPEFIEHVFEPFTRERNTTESRTLGTGLGMAIVKKYVDLMGGKIEVESTLGKGTTFTITLTHRIVVNPEEYLNKNLPLTADNEKFRGKRILLAEDNDLNAEIALAVLEDNGFAVDRAEDGVMCVEMLAKAEAGTYDLVLMDIQMPNMNGYDATRNIRKLEDKAKAGVPVIAMTANAFEEDKKNAFDAGMNGHVAKPVDVAQLMSELGRVLS